MNSPAKAKKSSSTQKVIIIAAVVIILLLAAVIVLLLRPGSNKDDEKIGYSVEAKVMLDEDSLQAAVDEAQRNAREGNVALQYQNNAFSSDGKTFSCYIANSPSNLYDMFLTIYANEELTDEIFLSDLIPPGSGFEEITLKHALNPGNHTVYVAVTQVTTDEETSEQVIKNQVVHTMEFHVE